MPDPEVLGERSHDELAKSYGRLETSEHIEGGRRKQCDPAADQEALLGLLEVIADLVLVRDDLTEPEPVPLPVAREHHLRVGVLVLPKEHAEVELRHQVPEGHEDRLIGFRKVRQRTDVPQWPALAPD